MAFLRASPQKDLAVPSGKRRKAPFLTVQRGASEIFCSSWSHRPRVVGLVQPTLSRAMLSAWTAMVPSSQSALTPLVERSSPPPTVGLDEVPSRSVRHPRARALASNGIRTSAAERSAGEGRSTSNASHDSGIGVAAGWLASPAPQPTSAMTKRSVRIRADDTRTASRLARKPWRRTGSRATRLRRGRPLTRRNRLARGRGEGCPRGRGGPTTGRRQRGR